MGSLPNRAANGERSGASLGMTQPFTPIHHAAIALRGAPVARRLDTPWSNPDVRAPPSLGLSPGM